MGVVADIRVPTAPPGDSLITFVDNECVVAIDIQRRSAATVVLPALSITTSSPVMWAPVPAVGDGHITVIVDAGVIAVNDGAGGACAADVRTPVFLIVALSPSMMMAVPPPSRQCHRLEVVVVPLPEINARRWRCPPLVAQKWCWWCVAGITMPVAPSVTLWVPGERVDGSIAGIITRCDLAADNKCPRSGYAGHRR